MTFAYLRDLLGCFFMGFFIALTYRNDPISSELRLMIATGFLGSLTTFSSYGLDTARLRRDDIPTNSGH
jgi:CrcB protein